MKRFAILAVSVSTLLIAHPALAQVTNEGLLGQAMGREQQRWREQQSSYSTDMDLILAQNRERELERCLAIAAGGSALPPECIALVAKPRTPKRHDEANASSTTPVLAQVAAPPSVPRKLRANTPSGFCLDVPRGYVGTGALNSPALSTALPSCAGLQAR